MSPISDGEPGGCPMSGMTDAVAYLLDVAAETGLTAHDLDELVCDAKSAEAAAVNNDGMHAQLTYLAAGGDAGVIAAQLRNLAREAGR
ncbi:hypothetical protein [Actinomadura atramentaria]|uniref:hypothetical protein n=1 Tax=Actinomadura atramentaria TaxID=1990 RepID=UPI00039BEA59|nr:hypothetical protein [Actinomadura atramentaria]